jgi:DNA modification methylase
MKYTDFLQGKHQRPDYLGFDVAESDIDPMLYKFQNAIVRWALKLGKAAIFAECGLGKTLMQLEWARHVQQYTDNRVLILAPLAVTAQTIAEGAKIGMDVVYCEDDSEIDKHSLTTITITNYDRLHKFDPTLFSGVVLDESSILKNFTGKTKRLLIDSFLHTPFKLACTATPAPNDYMELGNHADFLSVMPSNEMLMRWFQNDTMAAGDYILKPHGKKDFYKWLTSWAVCLSHPRDLGDEYDMPDFDLPPLEILEHVVAYSQASIDKAWQNGRLLPDTNVSSISIHTVKRDSLKGRIIKSNEIVSQIADDEPIIFWCDTNDEANALIVENPDAVEVRGSHSRQVKVERLNSFSNGDVNQIITKPSIAGFGLNWQRCTNQVLIGLSFSFEKLYQAIRRSYRFGVTKQVNIHMIVAETEGNVLQAIKAKQKQFKDMQEGMNQAMTEHGLFRDETSMNLSTPDAKTADGKNWKLYLGDCVEQIANIDDNSMDFGIHSPPFSNLYIYSNSEADMGNSANDDEFFNHYKFLIREMYRVTRPGRLCAVHCKDLPLYMNRDGAAGLSDFAGDIIRAFEEMDKPDFETYTDMSEYKRDMETWKAERKTSPKWVFHSRVTIWKDPVIEMQRTKNHGLLHKNFTQRAEACRQGMADYLIVFRKWSIDGGFEVTQNREIGEYIGTQPPEEAQYLYNRNGTPHTHKQATRTHSIATWQRYASPVWFDIDQTNVLNHKLARESADQKHICPLQLDVIERAIDLWTNKGDTVFSPFAGVGSELYSAIKMGRKAVGIELKESYFNTAIKHLKRIELAGTQMNMFESADLISTEIV